MAILTGAGNGIGRASAVVLAKAGMDVVCADINADTVETTSSTGRQRGGDALSLQVDVGDVAEINAMVAFLASPAARNITGQSYNVDGCLVTSLYRSRVTRLLSRRNLLIIQEKNRRNQLAPSRKTRARKNPGQRFQNVKTSQ